MCRKPGTLVSPSSTPTTIRAVANTYCQLLQSQSDNNAKLIVIDLLNELKTSHRKIMVDMIMDVLRALASLILDIRRKTIGIALELITLRNIDKVVQAPSKEVAKTQSTKLEKNGEYSQMLLFKDTFMCNLIFLKSPVVHLTDFLGDSDVASSAIGMVVFITMF
ncbi:hypothetical protein MKW94_030689 [Papaver nudicaule]|uniref:Uncharacterized protein n=1 Tax=Papaver nudicaule TaxID=74823 RepID=A0AA42ATU4_PAPNU|nr:hypothetical protein [Papaver nudicaule]MCL7042880.1 hypothetical protein [Papaver nudicaule]